MSASTSTTPRRVVSTERRARKSHTCDGCGERIAAGAVYLEHRAPAHFERLGNTTPLIRHECLACAGRLGRRSDQAPEDFMVPLFDPDGVA
ncbi:MAG: hypothetical protein BGO38_06900 [Cellulomonas sp. 73-145]|uniref:hypothetical protein n=1 Tax=Cellulomonas sp. 73-145 TaxID=1895739 RepID=UPI000929E04F|nr:hypothetical protein [Cellulomonas sp. 73-145]MBN9325946.1 hypothetical protein [Cellulomonas sp.]OJV57944.1 MAG: hypothetical protein BGO38_06900 [Cellulomonas sp. 73-145]